MFLTFHRRGRIEKGEQRLRLRMNRIKSGLGRRSRDTTERALASVTGTGARALRTADDANGTRGRRQSVSERKGKETEGKGNGRGRKRRGKETEGKGNRRDNSKTTGTAQQQYNRTNSSSSSSSNNDYSTQRQPTQQRQQNTQRQKRQHQYQFTNMNRKISKNRKKTTATKTSYREQGIKIRSTTENINHCSLHRLLAVVTDGHERRELISSCYNGIGVWGQGRAAAMRKTGT